MKSIFRKVLTITFVLICVIATAQNIEPLKIGDKMPDVYFTKMLNHHAPSGRLSDFKGKAIIIDMWFRQCAGCISAMKYLDTLQKEFKKDLQILPVTWQAKEEIEKFWLTNRNVKNITFTQVVEDTLIRELFPAVAFPHQVWIDKNGIVIAVTDGKETNRETVNKLINSEKLSLPEKVDELDPKIRWAMEPMMNIRYEENLNNLLYYSYFSKYRSEFNVGITPKVDKANKLVRMNFRNNHFIQMYHHAYANRSTGAFSTEVFHRPTRVIRHDTNPLNSKADFINYSNIFCYDLIYRDTTIANFGKYMIPELDRFFNLKSREETRLIPCYVISPNGKGTRFREDLEPTADKYVYNNTLKEKELLSANRQWPSWLEARINNFNEDLLLFEMGKERIINFEVRWNLDDLNQMNKELSKYDLKIEKTERRRAVIILEDAKL